MRPSIFFNFFRLFVLALLLSLSLTLPAPQASEASPLTGTLQQGEGGEQLAYDPDTGQLIFVGALPGSPIPSPAGDVSALSVEEQAMTFVAHYGPRFGLKQPANEVRLKRVDTLENGRRVVRYQQTYQGVPVFGGDLVVNMADSGALVAMAGKIALLPSSLDVTPVLTAEDAIRKAKELAASLYGVSEDSLSADEPGLWVYDERLFTPTTLAPRAVWKVEVKGGDRQPVYEVVLVNAKTGGVSVHYTLLDREWRLPKESLQPLARTSSPQGGVEALAGGSPVWDVYDSENTTIYPKTFVCSNSSPGGCDSVSDDWDAYYAALYARDTYSFYWEHHGRDSIDGAGMLIRSNVHYGDPWYSPNWYLNAFWDGNQMVYGDYLALDDVVAHELTHGVTQYTSDLIYLYQPGAINESLSDVWGELIDLSYAHDYVPNSDTTARWLLGEDLFGPAYAFRNMKNPPAKGDPDSMLSPLYYKGPLDNGGVHTNSGVNNKAAYLMTDGGTFNGYTVQGLGIEKVAAIYYKAQTEYLFPGADYLNLYIALRVACQDLFGIGDVCTQVHNALAAVKMQYRPAAINGSPVAMCPPDQQPYLTLFEDDFDDGDLSAWNLEAESAYGSITPSWTTYEGLFDKETSRALWAPGPSEIAKDEIDGGEERLTLAAPVALPAGSKVYLLFKHMYLFENWSTSNYDGGVVEYSVDGGLTWKDAKPLFSAGQNYNGTITKWPLTNPVNPLGGRAAFVRNSLNDNLHTRYNLTSLAGKSVKIRFRIGYDYYVNWGWFIDDVTIYTCVAVPNVPALLSPASGALVYDYTPRLDWADAVPDGHHYQVQIATDSAFSSLVYDETTTDSEFTPPADLTPNTKYYWRVRAYNGLDQTKGWSAARSFRTAMTPPVLTAPGNSNLVMTDRPDFDWEAVSGATGYTLQVSKNDIFTQVVHTRTVAAPATAYTPTVDLPGGMVLYWRVKANGANPSDWSEVRSFTTGNPPNVPALLSPANNALTTDYTPRLDWAMSLVPIGAPAFSYYELQVDNDADFSSPVVQIGISGQESHEYTLLGDLAPNTKYYWRVRAWNVDSEYSGWSVVRSFRTAVTPPVLVSPANDEELLHNRPTFDWNDVAGATGYTLQISTSPSFSSLLFSVNTTASTYTRVTDLPANKDLYWRVRANAVNGPSAWSDGYHFKTANPPSIPVLLVPLQGALNVSLTPTLDWKDSAVPLGTTLDHYQVQIATDSTFTSLVYNENTGLSEFTVPSNLDPNTKYYWRVRAYNTDGEYSSWSAVRYFRTLSTP